MTTPNPVVGGRTPPAPALRSPAGQPRIRTSDGVTLRVRDWGARHPFVFLAAWGLPSDAWDYQMAELSQDGIRCVGYDRRGHGRSDEPGYGYDFDTLAADLAAVLDGLDLRDVTLVTHSMAAGEAVRYLSRFGSQRIARLAFVAPTTPFLTQGPDNPGGIPLEAIEVARHRIASDFPRWIEEEEVGFWGEGASPALRAWGRGLMLRSSLPALLELHRVMAATDFRAELGRLRLPTLILQGDCDFSAPLPLTGARTADLVPGARLTVYEGAPHGLPFTHRERLNQDLRTFAGL